MKTAAICLALSSSIATQAMAADLQSAGERCAQAQLDVERYVRTVQSCSDAAFERHDADEADAVCWSAHMYEMSISDRMLALVTASNDPESDVSKSGCFKASVGPLMPAYLKANKWHIAYMTVRNDGAGKDTFAPLSVVLPK